MLYVLPIEPLEERYTAQMWQWICESLDARAIPYAPIFGDATVPVATAGHEFLSWPGTIAYKASQLRKVAELFAAGTVLPGDVFFVGDIWFPGIEGIRYLSQLCNVPVRLYGINYAGPFDPTDLTAPLLRWGQYQEAAWYAAFDKVFVGSHHHRKLIADGLARAGLNVRVPDVTGLVWNADSVRALAASGTVPEHLRGQVVVLWPHRLSQEKNVSDFYDLVSMLAPELPHVRWVISTSRMDQQYTPLDKRVEFLRVRKADYYALMRAATLMVSTAFHENFGYTVHEATALGTPVLCPRRADYPEMITSEANLYTTLHELAWKARSALSPIIKAHPVATLRDYGGFERMLDLMEVH